MSMPQAEDPGATILVVEDNRSARIALEAILDALGYHVLMTASAREALALFQAQADQVDLVMSDLIMPEISGPQLCTQLRAQKSGLPVIIMSGYPLEDERAQLEAHNIRYWIQKPFSMHQLEAMIQRALRADA